MDHRQPTLTTFQQSVIFTIVISTAGLIADLAQDCSSEESKERPAIREVFERTTAAIKAEKSLIVVNNIDDLTFQHFAEMHRLALRATATEVRKLPSSSRLYVLMLRHLVPSEELEVMRTRDVALQLFDAGVMGMISRGEWSMGEVWIEGMEATAQIIVADEPLPLEWHFMKQGGEWKMNLISLLTISDIAMKDWAAEEGLTENEYILKTLEVLSQRSVPADIWEPVIPSGAMKHLND